MNVYAPWQATNPAQQEARAMSKDKSIMCQAATIDRLRAENSGLRKRCQNLEAGQQRLMAILTTPEPPKADDWAEMVRQAKADIGDEHG